MSEIDLFSHAPVAMAAVGHDGRIVRVNAALCHLLGYRGETLVGRPLESLSHPDNANRTSAGLCHLLDDRSRQVELELQYVHSSGRTLWVLLAVSLVRSAEGVPLSFVAHVQDFSERKERHERTSYLADHDALTGLFSRRRFEEAMATHRHSIQRHAGHGALLLLDLDRFKSINDKLGHEAGDEVLKHAAAALRGRLRDTDALARLGGDEFAILLPDADLQQAQLVAADIVRVLRQTQTIVKKKKVTLTTSVGVVVFAERPADENPLTAADAAMYRAKRAGGNRWTMAADSSALIPAWIGRAVSAPAPQLAMGCVAALILATRYGYPTANAWGITHRSVATTIARLLPPV